MIKKLNEINDPIFDIFMVVQNYKKRGISTILLTIKEIDDLLDYAGYRVDDPMMTMYLKSLNSASEAENTDPNLRAELVIKTQKKLNEKKKKMTQKSR